MAKRLCKESTHLEIYHCLAADVSAAAMPTFLGRGGFAHVKLQPVVPRNFLASRYSCSVCDFWDMVCSLLSWLCKFVKHLQSDQSGDPTVPTLNGFPLMRSGEPSEMTIRQAILEFRNLAPRMQNSWNRGAAPNAPPAAWANFISGLSFGSLSGCSGLLAG